MKKEIYIFCLLLLLGGNLYGIINDLNDSTDNWTAIQYLNQSDFYGDAQANGGDIIGDSAYNQPGFYKRYDYGLDGEADGGDDTMAFRIRLASDDSSYLLIGFDVDDGTNLGPDGTIDFYLGVSFATGNLTKDKIAFYSPGSSANDSPATATFNDYSVYKNGNNNDFADYANLSPVVLGVNEGYTGTDASTNLDGGDSTDYFVSFQVEMNVINAAYQGISGTTNLLTADSEMMMVLGSSGNDNNFNQDFAGIDGTTGASLPWTDPNGPGAPIYTAEGTTPVPESSSYALMFGALAGIVVFLRRRR